MNKDRRYSLHVLIDDMQVALRLVVRDAKGLLIEAAEFWPDNPGDIDELLVEVVCHETGQYGLAIGPGGRRLSWAELCEGWAADARLAAPWPGREPSESDRDLYVPSAIMYGGM